MAYFRVLTTQLANIHSQLSKDDSWIILINADPDALGSAMALQRIIRKKVKKVHIARINVITRPDNLAMIRNLRIPVKAWEPHMKELYTKFAIVDSQPHHCPVFADIDFSIVIDHHPLPLTKNNCGDDDCKKKDCKDDDCFDNAEKNCITSESKILKEGTCSFKSNKKKLTKDHTCSLLDDDCIYPTHRTSRAKTYCTHFIPHVLGKTSKKTKNALEAQETQKMEDIRPDYGSNCTMLTEYLYNANIRPGKYLATALQYGIRTDTGIFGRKSTEVDLRAYHYLSRFADQNLLMRITRSEYFPQWLPYFSRAFDNFRPCGIGHFTYISNVDSPDILVVVADFFLKVHGLKYIVVAGIHEKQVICIFRGSDVNLGLLAQHAFSEYGSAGGHKMMARAEIPLADLRKAHKELSFNLRKKELSSDENAQLEKFLLARLKQFGRKKTLKD